MRDILERYFKLKAHGTTARVELIAGMTTFMTMAYILVVNPLMLSDAGMDIGAVFTATALSAIIATVVMGILANLPIALAPGMGLNAFFAYTIVIGMGYDFRFALTAVLLEGLIFVGLTLCNVREAILNSIPMCIKRAVSGGIGLFIAFIGLANCGLVIKPDAPELLVQLGDVRAAPALLALLGLVVTGVLLARRVKGALLLGIVAATILGIPLGVTVIPGKFSPVSLPPAPYWMAFEWGQIFTVDMLVVLLTLLFMDIFDTAGTLLGVAVKGNLLDEQGRLPRARQALFADAIGTVAGACLGTSTVTSYVESASGLAEGGRTGLTALSTAALFALALFFAPLFALIPSAATAPALVMVGLFMLSPVKEIDFNDYTEAIPAFLTLLIMPLTYSISDGIFFGVLAYVFIKLLGGRAREVSFVTFLLAVLFAARLFL